MNLLTQSLLKELLGEQKTVAIYGGGFKPPTKGHFTVAQEALKELPDIDELKIFVGGGVRDGITQNESVQIWKIYQPYLSNKIEVEPVSSPVKAVLDYAKENPNEKVYWILGAREGDEDDLKDIENRTKSLDKYPNIEVKIITTAGGVSGTKTRASISSGNKENFFNLIPNIQEKEEIWNILSPIVKEGIVDNMKTKIKDFISAVKQEGQETKEVVGLLIHAAQGKIKLTDEQKEYIGNQLKDVLKLIGLTAIAVLPGGSIAAVLLKVFKQTHLITPSSMMNELVTDIEVICDNCGWDWKIADGGDDLYICHKCGHDNNPDLEEASDPQAGTALPYGSGFAPVKENDPFGINAYARELVKETFKEDWNLKEGMLSLSKYMIDNGMNIKPLPKIKVIDNDAENASNLLGKTAYYNPVEKSITLFTMNRHPKDVLRSFAHEMVHHMQNLEGRLNNIVTQNTNEDGDLPEIEREAYEKGNMMLRSWEDNIKNV
jgi:hypothetical protein